MLLRCVYRSSFKVLHSNQSLLVCILILICISLLAHLLFNKQNVPNSLEQKQPGTMVINTVKFSAKSKALPQYPKLTKDRQLDFENLIHLKKTPLIVFWEKIIQSKTAYDVLPIDFNTDYLNCSDVYPKIVPCAFSSNRSKSRVADVLAIGIQEWTKRAVVPDFKRPLNQPWLFYEIESPAHLYDWMWENSRTANKTLPLLNGLVNWTMTYRLDSTIPAPYASFEPRQTPNFTRSNCFRTKHGTAIFIASKCDNRMSHREDYVVQLIQAGLAVEHIGSCILFQNILAPFAKDDDCHQTKFYGSSDECGRKISARYKFLLAFENSLCLDYVTEKFYRAASLDVIPVVLNYASMERFAPPNSYIDASKFGGPKQLAEYLIKVASNETLFESYFWWKPYYNVVFLLDGLNYFRTICRMCAHVHNLLSNSNNSWPAYSDVEAWWVGRGNCSEGVWNIKRFYETVR